MNKVAGLTVKLTGGALPIMVGSDGDTSEQRPEVKWEPVAMDRQRDQQVQRPWGGTLKEESRREGCGSR